MLAYFESRNKVLFNTCIHNAMNVLLNLTNPYIWWRIQIYLDLIKVIALNGWCYQKSGKFYSEKLMNVAIFQIIWRLLEHHLPFPAINFELVFCFHAIFFNSFVYVLNSSAVWKTKIPRFFGDHDFKFKAQRLLKLNCFDQL